jgi:hypothetical protein
MLRGLLLAIASFAPNEPPRSASPVVEPQLDFLAEGYAVHVATYEQCKELFETRTYRVSHLAILAKLDLDALLERSQIDCVRAAAKQSLKEFLTCLIRDAVAPESWQEKGGVASVSFSTKDLTLVVYQTRENQEQVEDLLRSLQRWTSLCIALNTRVVKVPESVVTEFSLDRDTVKRDQALFNSSQVSQLVRRDLNKGRVNLMPVRKATVCNVERAVFRFPPEVLKGPGRSVELPLPTFLKPDRQFSVTPVLSADRHFVQLRVNCYHPPVMSFGPPTPLVAESAAAAALAPCVPEGKTLVLDAGQFGGDRLLVLITPEIIASGD